MSETGYSTEFHVDQAPEIVHEAISDVRSWWSGHIDGDTRTVGGSFGYDVPGVHFSRQEILVSVPGSTIVWKVVDSNLSFTKDPQEWTGTVLRFEIVPKGDGSTVRFTHSGLVPTFECYEACSGAWALLIEGNLKRRIETGLAQPDVFKS